MPGKQNGRSKLPEFRIWKSLRQRCFNQKSPSYRWYGARGISICERWSCFDNFLKDMGPRPEGFSLDRIDGDKDYAPDNCRWADPITQANNKSKFPRFLFEGRMMTIAEICRERGLDRRVVHARIALGWSLEAAVFKPVKRKSVS